MKNQAEHFARSERFVEKVVAHQRRLYAYILTLIPDPNEASDVLQQTNMALWRNAERFEVGTNFNAWAYRMAYFAVLEHRENKKRSRARFTEELVDRLSQEVDSYTDEEESRLKALSKCLSELPTQWRDLIHRRYVKDEMVKKIAPSLGQSSNAVANTLFRIRHSLWKCIRRRMMEEAS